MDASGSLTAAARKSSLEIVDALLRDRVLDEDRYTVMIADGQLAGKPLAAGKRLSNNAVEERRYRDQIALNKRDVEQGFDAWSKAPQRTRTCLADSLAAAQRFFLDQRNEYRPEIYLISDMIEDCDTRDAGMRVDLCRLQKQQFGTVWTRLASEPGAATVPVTAILPLREMAPGHGCTRALPDLDAFWQGAAPRLGLRIRLHYFADLSTSAPMLTSRTLEH